MKIKIICSLTLFLFTFILSAKELKYQVSSIPNILKENAHTVMRLYQQEVEIKSEKSAIVKVTEVRTILNKNGLDNIYFREAYSPMNKISNIKGIIYNELGERIKTLSIGDIIDRSYISGFSMYDDNRVKFYDPKNMTFPFTVEYSYEIDLKQTLFLPSWSHDIENVSFETSIFTVKTPANYAIRYKEYNLAGTVQKSKEGEKDIYSWSLNNLCARNHEPMLSNILPGYPMVKLVPNNFEVEGTKGTTESWKELGQWVTSLIDQKDKLPETTVSKIKEITATCTSESEKVKKVYEYMQQKTRYVSIQVGIGGWQPFDAESVDKNSYGDCKALANYTKSLLSAVGINSYYTLVKAGADNPYFDAAFPSSQFNHAIVCVPIEKDTLWLECTNQRMPFGFNGDFTDDRQVLLIDGENSHLARTRIYPASENSITRTSNVVFSDVETGSAVVKTKYLGLCYDLIVPIYYADDAEKLKQVTQSIDLPSFTLNNFKYTENRSKTPYFDEDLNLSFTNYIQKMGDVALLPLNFMNKLTSIPDKVRNRKTDMCIRRAYMEQDSINYQLPKGYKVTALPEKSDIKGKFGKYFSKTVHNGNSVTYVRSFELFKCNFPKEAYAEFRDFLEEISSADNAMLSLIKE